MKLTINQKTSIAEGKFGSKASQIAIGMEGRKTWISPVKVRFETSQRNIDLILGLWTDAIVQDERLSAADTKALGELKMAAVDPAIAFKMAPMDFQLENFNRFRDQDKWAIFSEQGTGKTKVALDIISWRALKGTVTGVIILSSPRGVHAQWIEEQLPKHLWDGINPDTYIWDGKKTPDWIGKSTGRLQIISGNIDMLRGKGFEILRQFAQKHRGKLLILVDESDSIKNHKSQRSVKLQKLAEVTQQRSIMTGTPIATDLTDEFSQFYFLDPDIIGHKYVTSFRAQYCRMGGFENRAVVGHINIDKFKDLTAPFIFRATKAELDLPEKIYDSVVFDLSPSQRRMIRELRDQFFAEVNGSSTVSVKNGATALMRIQQITNGFAVDEGDGTTFIDNPRLDALLDLRRQISGPVIIWCRFKEDIAILKKSLPSSVTIYGADKQDERELSKAKFLSGEAQELLATPGAAGKGVDGLQKVCSDAIYYSNSYNAIDRWQSEDRIHRMGMKGSATYFDLIARGSIDRAILANLKRKKDLSNLVLDDIRNVMESIE